MSVNNRYQALDGIRGIAALMVVFYHYSLKLFDPAGMLANNFFVHTSYVFVDFFFVLSGFVIAANYWGKITSIKAFKTFTIKRFARLYPLLLVTVLIFVGLKIYGMLFTNFNFDTKDYGFNDVLIETLEPLTFLNSTPLISKNAGMNPVSWFISAQMISYFVFALTILFFPKRIWPFIILILLCISFIIFYKRYLYTSDYGFVRGILNFSCGVLIFKCFDRYKRLSIHRLEIPFTLLLILAFALIYYSKTELTHLILPILFSLGVYIFAYERGVISKLLKLKSMQYLGRISYSIYLNHFIVLWIFYHVSWNLLKINPTKAYSKLGLFIVVLLVIATSAVTYQWIELRGGKWIKRKMLK